jgi:hypothetical protein
MKNQNSKTDDVTNYIINNIIFQLNHIDVTGEEMQYILESVGMEDQMLRQLIMTSDQDRIEELYGERLVLEDTHKMVNEYKETMQKASDLLLNAIDELDTFGEVGDGTVKAMKDMIDNASLGFPFQIV